METIRKIDAGEKFTHATVGDLSAFTGKQFVKDCIGTTGCEISFGTLNPGEAVPFFHSHQENEEVYIVLRGSGDFQVDDTAFPIVDGSIVRVATHCNRSPRCTPATRMLYLCVQAKEDISDQCTMGEAEITAQTKAVK